MNAGGWGGYPRWCAGVLALLLPAVWLAASTLPLSPQQVEEIDRYARQAREAVSADELRQYAIRLGELRDARSVAALGAVLRRCDVLESGDVATVNPKSIDITRAYAMNALVRLSAYDRGADTLIREHFRISPAVCLALVKSGYAPVYDLMDKAIARYTSVAPDEMTIEALRPLTPMLQFALRARPDFFRDAPAALPRDTLNAPRDRRRNAPAPDDEDEFYRVTTERDLVDRMTMAAVILDHTRAPQALRPLEQLLQHRYAFLWDKPVYRAIYNVRLAPEQRAGVLRRQLRAVRNRDRDECVWNWDQPASIVFSIDDISSEAMALLTFWRLPGTSAAKLAEAAPSLESSSFTARAAAIDCLASLPQAPRQLLPVLQARDPHTRRFLALRLGMETNRAARAILTQLARDRDPAVAAAARR